MRKPPWKPIGIVAIVALALLSLLLLPACCCVKGPAASTVAPPMSIPPIGSAAIPIPTEAESREPTQTQMQNVDFHVDADTVLKIHRLRGEMVSKQPGSPLNLDNKTTFVLRVDTGEIGMTGLGLDNLMNRYVFKPGGPLRNLHITMEGKQLRQEGIIHKIVDLPFTMWADVSATSDGRIRIHPTKIDICGVNGLGLLKALGQSMEKLIGKDLPKDHGVSVDVNDLLLDPGKMLPPPDTELRLVGVRVEGNELVQTFDAGRKLPPLELPRPEEKNTMYYRGGTLRMGKLLMVGADMQVVDTDPSDAFDFFIDRYNEELVEGLSRNQRNYGLVVFMRDFEDVGKPARPGERLVR